MKTHHIYGAGAALVDTEITVTDHDLTAMAVTKGVMTLVDEARQTQLIRYLEQHQIAADRASGGSAANSIIAAGYFGCRNFYSCKVADDDNGQLFLEGLAAAGVGYPDQVSSPEGITGKCLVMITPDAERSMNTFLGISETLSPAEISTDAVASSEYVYIEGYLVSSPSGRAAAIALREAAERHQVRTSLSLSDPAMVQFFRDGLNEMLGQGVDLLFCNRDEAIGFTDTHNLDDAMEALKKVSKTFAVTCGAEGAIIFDGQQLINIPGTQVKAVDTNGAGDMFAGAFLYAITHGHDFKKAGEFASYAAAQVVAQYGPRLRPEQHAEIKAKFFG